MINPEGKTCILAGRVSDDKIVIHLDRRAAGEDDIYCVSPLVFDNIVMDDHRAVPASSIWGVVYVDAMQDRIVCQMIPSYLIGIDPRTGSVGDVVEVLEPVYAASGASPGIRRIKATIGRAGPCIIIPVVEITVDRPVIVYIDSEILAPPTGHSI